MMKKILAIALCVVAGSAQAIDGFYLGGQLGHVGLTEPTSRTYSNTIGFGIDLGVRTNPLLDLVFSFQRSGHSGGGPDGLTLYSQTVSADFHFGEFNDFEFSLGAGPGFYFFKTNAVTESKFGVNAGSQIDVLVDEHLRIGLGARYHAVFAGSDPGRTAASYWTVMMRLGYLFSSE